MNTVAKFEKVSKDQFLKDCWDYGGYEREYGEFHYPETNTDTQSYYSEFNEMLTSFVNCCSHVWENIKLPTRSTKGSAGYDFYLPDNTRFSGDWYQYIPTGIRCKIDPGYVLMLYPRSSWGFKHNFNLANTTGIIDSDYYDSKNEGHIIIKAFASKFSAEAGTRFVQGIFLPYYLAEEDEVNNERTGGFGSTGT